MRLTKHHGWGNDFLVLVDAAGDQPAGAALAARLCHRRTGVGADGLIRVTPAPAGTGADLAMELWNADGSAAEMSGNGIRCLAQAARMAGLIPPEGEVAVLTGGGLRRLRIQPYGEPGVDHVEVEMGTAREAPLPGGTPPPGAVTPQKELAVDLGNPHLVRLHADRASLDADAAAFAAGERNVEFVVAGPAPDVVEMRVVERGVGETPACGTGACAAAWAAHHWGLAGRRVAVRQPGGTAVVHLGEGGIVLAGPACYVATVEVPGA